MQAEVFQSLGRGQFLRQPPEGYAQKAKCYGGTLMFREMRRSKQELSQQECVELLNSQPRGVLSLLGDDGYPYGIPMTHWYNAQDGKLYFHGAKSGHKIDALNAWDKVSFCVYDAGYRKEGEWSLNIRSVVVFGRIRAVDDPKKAAEICHALCRKFSDDPDYPQREWRQAGDSVLCLELTPEHITGKLVNES
jgi:hypothetical protein